MAMARTGVVVTVREVEVDSVDDAAAAGMHGSPTILIDGTDPFTPAGGEVSLSCRLFRTGDGVEGAPSLAELVAALSKSSPRS